MEFVLLKGLHLHEDQISSILTYLPQFVEISQCNWEWPKKKILLPVFSLSSGPSYCTTFLPVFITQSNAVLSFPFPQHLSSSSAPHRVPAAPSDTVYPCVSGKGNHTIMPVSETSSEMGIKSASSCWKLCQKLCAQGPGFELHFTLTF
jgi:hypothetical protein